MGKTVTHSLVTRHEFWKLKVLLVQTANDVINCLKTLKVNLGKYDRRHGLYFRSTSKHFLRTDIRVAKELAADLRYAAKRIDTNKNRHKSVIAAARLSANATADAMHDLVQSGRIYDQNCNKGGGLKSSTSIMDDLLRGNDSNQVVRKRGSCQNGIDKCTTTQGLFGHKHIGDTIRNPFDTVEAVVLSTLRDSFGGFAALKQQITATTDALSPLFATRAKEAGVDVAHKLIGSSSFSSAGTDNQPLHT